MLSVNKTMKGLILLALVALVYSDDATVRLVNRDGVTNTEEGRVQVYLNDNWGEICADHFGVTDARVVCKQLGHDGGKLDSGNHGIGNDGIVIGNVNCNGDETSILDCSYE